MNNNTTNILNSDSNLPALSLNTTVYMGKVRYGYDIYPAPASRTAESILNSCVYPPSPIPQPSNDLNIIDERSNRVASRFPPIADYDADSMNILSIPVGVTFAKEFTGDAWTVKPSLELTLTGNFGDDETDGTVHWAGVENLSTNVSSEVIDNFTYGATLGVAAKTGNFSLGLGVNYTGSSNVDEFGVNANARFVF